MSSILPKIPTLGFFKTVRNPDIWEQNYLAINIWEQNYLAQNYLAPYHQIIW